MSRIGEEQALAALDSDTLVADLTSLVRTPSETGDERAAVELVAALAEQRGLAATIVEHDLAELRAAPDHPGEEAPRTELLQADVVLPGGVPGAPRLCLNGHVDVVHEGSEPWTHGPWSAAIDEEGFLYGRGSMDMKAAVVACLHAMAAVARAGITLPGDVVLQAVSSEEDGGLGTFAALRRDAAFAAALVCEPTAFDVVCAQAGALTFSGVVTGRAAHAAVRLEGVSAIDRYVPIHLALAKHERAVNSEVAHPLMREHALPYPLLVGRVEAGRWSSQVPDELRFEGRLGVRIGEEPSEARAALQAVVDAAAGDGAPVPLRWSGGQFAPAETPTDHPWIRLLGEVGKAELGRRLSVAGVTWGADMRHFTARGIPCAMLGTSGFERAHAVDERVRLTEVEQLARIVVRALVRFGR